MLRLLGLVVAVLALVAGTGTAARAQDATPAAATFADTLGLPELRITATDAGFEGVPAETAAGRYVLTFTNNASEPAAVGFLQLPAGRTVADLAPPPGAPAPPGPDATPGPGMAEGTPAAGGAAGSPAAGGEDPFGWLYETYTAGGAGAPPGGSVQAIVDLLPGDYAAWADDPESPIPPVALSVTGEAASPAAGQEPAADVTVTATGTNEGYDLAFSGEFAAGPQTVEFFNDSDQPHFFLFIRSPGPITVDQLMALLQLPEGGTPAPGIPSPEEFVDAAYAASISVGTREWLAVNLEPGYYIVACFIPDRENPEVPHAAEGLVDVIQVGGVATPTAATPAP